MTEATHAYVGIKDCGCMVAAVVIRPEYAKDTAKDVAGFLRQGLTVDRRPIEDVRNMLKSCDCDKKANDAQRDLFAEATK